MLPFRGVATAASSPVWSGGNSEQLDQGIIAQNRDWPRRTDHALALVLSPMQPQATVEGGKMGPQQARQRQVRIFSYLVRGTERAAE